MTDEPTPDQESRTTCSFCGRVLDRDAGPDDPALDCGGDCWGCVGAFERTMGYKDDEDAPDQPTHES